jgi:hypothetical protein
MIQMARDARESRGRDIFACSNALWVLLQHLGRTFGWQPMGTTYLASGKQPISLPARHDYHPGGTADRKQVDAEDAVAWARALDAAQQSVQFTELLMEQHNGNTADSSTYIKTLHSLIYEFTEFSYGGTFTFAEAPSTADEELTSLPNPRDALAAQRRRVDPDA